MQPAVIHVIIIIIIIHVPAKKQGASTNKLQVKAANILPLDGPDPSKTQSTGGTVLSIYTAPRQPGSYIYILHIIKQVPSLQLQQ